MNRLIDTALDDDVHRAQIDPASRASFQTIFSFQFDSRNLLLPVPHDLTLKMLYIDVYT